jgi:hypothetical protein
MPSWLTLPCVFAVCFAIPALWAWGHSGRLSGARDAMRDSARYWAILIVPACVLGALMVAVMAITQQ